MKTSNYHYAASNVTSYKNRNGDTISYEYDALNRLVKKSWPNGQRDITYLYDIAGRVVEVNDAGDVTAYSYDRIGRVTEVTNPDNKVVGYEYDELGRRTKLIYPDNIVPGDSYITYEYDELGRLTKIEDESSCLILGCEYDELSRRTLAAFLGNDANAVYEYDIADRLTKLTNNLHDGNSIVFDYNDYDKAGNRLSMKVDDTDEHSYAYDELYQLTAVNYPGDSTVMYYYDKLGNRTSVVNGGTEDYSSNNLNQYSSVGGTGYSYDKNGNLTNDGIYKYYYDCENHLSDVNDQSNSRVASYKYDFAGRRAKKTVYGETDKITKYCYDGDQVVSEYDYNDVSEDYDLARVFIYGPAIDEPICMIDVADNNKVYYYHFDGLGSVGALSDENEDIVERYEYDVFRKTNHTGPVNKKVRIS